MKKAKKLFLSLVEKKNKNAILKLYLFYIK